MSNEKMKVSPDILFPLIEEHLDQEGTAEFTVTGMSMWPFLCGSADKVFVEKADTGRLKKGDIVLFRTPVGNYMLHRITGLKDDMFETTGDGNCFRDGWFQKDCIIAKVTAFTRKGRRIRAEALTWRAMAFVWSSLYPVRGRMLKIVLGIAELKGRFR